MILTPLAEGLFDDIDWLARRPAQLMQHERGTVVRVLRGVIEVTGFSTLMADELIALPGGGHGLALELAPGRAGVVVLDAPRGLRTGDIVHRTGQVAAVPTGPALLGRVVTPLGAPLDALGAIHADRVEPVERAAPAIMDRAPITRPLQTGIKVVDTLVPIGRGQRELIVGDRQTGKTAIAVDTILNQGDSAGGGVIAVYCAVGQRGDAVARVLGRLRAAGAMARTVVVVAGADDPPGLQYLAPYAATTIAERFMHAGRDVLIIYDDLTRHARAWRELSLLLRRPPGREAYPGDIFYVHSRLLERATQLNARAGGGSLTALPVVETQAQNLAAYIPTNLISITDGQIYLSPDLFRRGQLPAVDVGRSVSRVGGKAQLPAFRALGGPLKLAYAQFEELESFARFGARLDADSQEQLARGERVRAVLRQDEGAPLDVAAQVLQLLAVTEGLLDRVPLADLPAALDRLRATVATLPAAAQIADGARLDEGELRAGLVDAARRALTEWLPAAESRGADHGDA